MTSPVSREELAAELRAVDSRIAAMESRIDARFSELRADLAALPTKSNLFNYAATMAGIGFAVLAIFVGVMSWRQDQFIASSDKPPPSVSAPPPNIIINVPPAPATPVPPAKP